LKVTFQITGIRNNYGFVRGIAYTSSTGFPENYKYATALAQIKATKGTTTLTFNLKAKEAAFVFIHDEKDIKKLEKNFLGLPKSGIAVTNWNRLSKPKYDSSVIKVASSHKLKIKYF